MSFRKLIKDKISGLSYRLGVMLIRSEYVPYYVVGERTSDTIKRKLEKANGDALALHSLRREIESLKKERNTLKNQNTLLKMRLIGRVFG